MLPPCSSRESSRGSGWRSALRGESGKPQVFAARMRKLGPGADAELAVDARERRLDGVLGEEEGGRNLPVRTCPRRRARRSVARLPSARRARARGRRCARARRVSARPRAARRAARSGRARPRASRGRRRASWRVVASGRARAASVRGGTDRCCGRARRARARSSAKAPSRSPRAASSSARQRARIASAQARSSALARGSQVARIAVGLVELAGCDQRLEQVAQLEAHPRLAHERRCEARTIVADARARQRHRRARAR